MDTFCKNVSLILLRIIYCSLSLALIFSTAATAEPSNKTNHDDDGPEISFTEIVADGSAGIDYQRAFSPSQAVIAEAQEGKVLTSLERFLTPHNPFGSPGVALFDHDNDGDLDIYVTNGPGTANSLFSNQLQETGYVTFIDVGESSGAGLVDQDSSGVCYGDLDNDGDEDLVVLGPDEPNRLLENLGDGTFRDVSKGSGIGGGNRSAHSCSLADVDQDGLLDLFVGNTHTWENVLVVIDPFNFYQHDQLFLNQGHHVFVDVSASSGIEDLLGMPPGVANLTWATAALDIDLDGDVDLVAGTDQPAVIRPESLGGSNIGLIRIFENDGTGHFTESTDPNLWGNWMGSGFGDFDCDDRFDMFFTNTGSYTATLLGLPYEEQSSRWFLGRGEGRFADSRTGDLKATPFGWGVAVADFDNDGDPDISYQGGFYNLGFIVALRHGIILRNEGECTANFEYLPDALSNPSRDFERVVHGLASGDLDNNGFVDLVSVAAFTLEDPLPLFQANSFDSPFDGEALHIQTFVGTPDGQVVWNQDLTGISNGDLTVELNNGNDAHSSISVELMGTVDLLRKSRVNRDGVGAVVRFQPRRGQSTLQPIMAGSSFASQHSMIAHFGMGNARRGTLEVLWPGGVRNRLDHVKAGEQIVFPEIPCNYADSHMHFRKYRRCVQDSLRTLVRRGVLDHRERARFMRSALRAYRDVH